MKILGVFLFYFISFNLFAGTPKELSFEEAKEMNVRVNLWQDIPEEDRVDYKEQMSCTPIEISVPLFDKKHPELVKLEIKFELYKSKKLFINGQLDISSFKKNKTGLGYGCLPFDDEYRVSIIFSYNPESGIMLCPPAYKINDLSAFVKSLSGE